MSFSLFRKDMAGFIRMNLLIEKKREQLVRNVQFDLCELQDKERERNFKVCRC
jgi:hypothetical protein